MEDLRENILSIGMQNWMSSRIPVRNALEAFVPNDQPTPASIETYCNKRPSRWYPEDTGIRVWVEYDGKEYDPSLFKIVPNALDHEACDNCASRVPAMQLCYVTKPGLHYYMLCTACYNKYISPSPKQKMMNFITKILGKK